MINLQKYIHKISMESLIKIKIINIKIIKTNQRHTRLYA